ncbi:MAG: 50S ribosomal protein L6 [Rhodothermales bacterium]|nr:50S ribosomal protein L6 [Rhodothermales bacterium]
MSRVGLLPIPIAETVKVDVAKNNVVTVKGPKGELSLQVDPDISVSLNEGQLSFARPTDQKRHKAMHGLYRALVNSMVTGVSDGYKKELEIIGVGFRAAMSNGVLELALGFSHPIYFVPPDGIAIEVDTKRTKNTIVSIEGIDKQLVGQVAAKLRSLRPPEPYKGKGVRYVDEYVRRKAGKTAAR